MLALYEDAVVTKLLRDCFPKADDLRRGLREQSAVDGQTSVEVRMGEKESGGRRWEAWWRPTFNLPVNATVTAHFERWHQTVSCMINGS